MVLETEPLKFAEWFPSALAYWLAAGGLLGLIMLLLGYLAAAVRHGPLVAGDMTARLLGGALGDLRHTSVRRIYALMRLTIQESIRRRVLIVLVLYGLTLAFASWFFRDDVLEPAQLYLSTVTFISTLLALLMALLLSVFGLPTDIQNRTITTVVTKPVRPTEIVLGRILGYTLVSTVVLLVMGVANYIFAVRMLHHTHELTAGNLEPVADSAGKKTSQLQGKTSKEQGHQHDIVLHDSDTLAATDVNRGHWHAVTIETVDGNKRYVVGPPRDQLEAKVPHYGRLRFRDREGREGLKEGINVGNMWTYRSHIQGATQMAAIWTFDNLRPEDYAEGLPLRLTITVFRTFKGDTSDPTKIPAIPGSLVLRNPRTKLASSDIIFRAREYYTDEHLIPRKLTTRQASADGKAGSQREIDLFNDLVDNGQLEIELTCLAPSQFFGMAQPDLYLLSRKANFELNFVKTYVGVWLQMVLVVTYGVMFSTFLNGPVSMLACLLTVGVGQMPVIRRMVEELIEGKRLGGGPLESFYRTVMQLNMTTPLDPGPMTSAIKNVDAVLEWIEHLLFQLLPNLADMSDANYLAYGFDIPIDRLAVHVCSMLAFLVPVLLLSFVLFKLREVAR